MLVSVAPGSLLHKFPVIITQHVQANIQSYPNIHPLANQGQLAAPTKQYSHRGKELPQRKGGWARDPIADTAAED